MTSSKSAKTDSTLYFVYRLRSRFGFGTRWFRQDWQRDQRAVLTQIEAIVRTNAPLPEGLLKCSLDAPNARQIHVLRTLSGKTGAGMGLADAMQSLGSWCPGYCIAQIRAGERTGQLAKALESIISNINADMEHGRTLRNHTAYFVCIAAIELQIMAFLSLRVFPVFMEILTEFGHSAFPLPVRVMAAFSGFVRAQWAWILTAASAVVILFVFLRILYRVSGLIQSAVLAIAFCIPFARRICRDTQIQRLSRALQLRLAAGVPLPDALKESAAEGLPRPYRRMLERCSREVERGSRLSTVLITQHRLAGSELPELVHLGEMREDLEWAFGEAVRLYTHSNRRAKRVWAEAVVPIGVALCAVGVIIATTGAFSMFAAMSDAVIADL